LIEPSVQQALLAHRGELEAYVRRIVGDPDDAQDVVQSSLLRAMTSGAQARPAHPRAWLFAIAHNQAIDHLRRRRDELPLLDHHSPLARSTEEHVHERADLAELVEDLAQMPERQRAALLLRVLWNLDYAAIGANLSISAGAARQAVYEARRGLEQRAQGRAVSGEPIRGAVAAGDRRTTRSLGVQAHLRSCEGCRSASARSARGWSLSALLGPLLPIAWWRGLAAGGAGQAETVLGASAGTQAASLAVVATLAGGLLGVPAAMHHTSQRDRASAPAGNALALAKAARGLEPGGSSRAQRRGAGRAHRRDTASGTLGTPRSPRGPVVSAPGKVPAPAPAPSHGGRREPDEPDAAGIPAPAPPPAATPTPTPAPGSTQVEVEQTGTTVWRDGDDGGFGVSTGDIPPF
jgi:RNA polymerase sigma factor (sigma-70 family)